MRLRLLALLPALLLGSVVLPGVAQTPSRQRITDLSGEVIAPGPVRVDRQWAAPISPYPVRVTERIINRMRITELTAGPLMPPPGVVPRRPAPFVPKAAPPGPDPALKDGTAPAPVETYLKIAKWSCGRVIYDEEGQVWALVYGQQTYDRPAELDGWLLPHASDVPFFYTRDGRLFRQQQRPVRPAPQP